MNSDDVFEIVKETMPEISSYGPFRLELCDAEEVENVIFDLCSEIVSRDKEAERLKAEIEKRENKLVEWSKRLAKQETEIESMHYWGGVILHRMDEYDEYEHSEEWKDSMYEAIKKLDKK